MGTEMKPVGGNGLIAGGGAGSIAHLFILQKISIIQQIT
jgi:hypothetical protein